MPLTNSSLVCEIYINVHAACIQLMKRITWLLFLPPKCYLSKFSDAFFCLIDQAIDIIVEHLEKESNLYKRVDLFFLVDSITQCSRNQKGRCQPSHFWFIIFYDGIYDYVKNYVGGAGDVYPSLIQAVLPRILYAAAPPGNSAWENRKQCLKVSTFDGLESRHHMLHYLFFCFLQICHLIIRF